MAIGRVNTGGSGSGGTLVVTGVAGDTITATKDGKTYTRTFNSAGKAVFRGLATGIWALTMTNGSQTVTRNVTITADYSLTMAYFTATITVTYPAGSTCTCANGSTVLTAPDTSGNYTFTVTNTGDWTVSCTDGTQTASKTVEITEEGQSKTTSLFYNIYLFYNGYNNTDLAGSPSVKGVKYNSSGEGTAVTPTLALKSDSMSLVCNAEGVEAGSGILYWSKAVDVTDFNTLELAAVNNSASGTTGWIRLGVADAVPSYITGWPCTNNALSDYIGEMQFDLSNITGMKYIIIGFHRGNQSWTIKRVELI